MEPIPNDATGDALRRFIETGSDLTKPMEIEFFVAVPTQEAGNRFAPIVEAKGYKVSVEKNEETNDWTCYCSRTLIREYSAIVKIEKTLTELAEPFNGYADGFGSYGNKELKNTL